MNKFTKGLAASAITAAMVMPLTASATNGILPLGNGMVAHGFGGAGIANAGDAMAGVDNPALIARTGNQWEIGASLFSPRRAANIGGGYVDSDTNYFVIPQGAFVGNINSKWDWAVLVSALGGMNTDYPATLAGESGGFDLSGLIIAPTASFKIAPKHSIGLSVLIGYEMMKTDGIAAFGLGDHSDSATGAGVKIGYAGDMGENTTLGVFYQSVISMSEMSEHCDTADGALAGVKANGGSCALNLPEMYGLGIAHKFNDKVKLVADIMQVNWAGVDVFGYSAAKNGFGWEDQTIFKIGAEFKSSESLAWRIGYNHGKSPIKDESVQVNVLAPAVTEDHFTLGLGQALSKKSDLNYYVAYIPENEQTDSGSGAKIKMWQWAAGIGYNAKF